MWHTSGSCCEQCFSMTHMLRFMCPFSGADDAVYHSSLKEAFVGLSVRSKLTVVLFPGNVAFFHK